ncbi:EAL domain-containing protein [Marinobacter sp. R17]|uniref:EAL domain-containing protein n=1 Tax=Marinobacter sp. R17 TaxID=2484250 RepID=UPI000F4C6B6B|nr:EAL domain-containing protein [Marinobacter sp. R17]ROT98849.1 EAL domain-containing protein [Marinobacter sp. R17]
MADPHAPRGRYWMWFPLALFLALGIYGYLLNLTPVFDSGADSRLLPPLLPTAALEPGQSPVSYRLASLDRILSEQSWNNEAGWQTLAPNDNGLGYLSGPATFRVTLDNPTAETMPLLLDLQAPSLDQVRAVRIAGHEPPHTLPTLGDSFPFGERLVELPSLIWPLRLAPHSQNTLLFEVINAGPTLFPLHLSHPEHLLSHAGSVIAWKAVLYGVLLFALVFDLALLLTLRSMAAAWLTCLLASILYSQLCVDGFGLWLVWPEWPALNNLLTPMLALSAAALLGFARHFLHLTGRPARLCLAGTGVMLTLALLAPLHLPLLGQGTVLIAGSATLVLVLGLSLLRWPTSVSARHLAIALLLLLAGAATAMARTVSWMPVNALTSSGFYLGTGAASVFLTLVVGYRLVEERRRRFDATFKVVEERRLRARLEQDYDQLMASHRVTGRPDRPVVEQTLDQLAASHAPFVVGLLRLERYGEIERALGYQEAENLLRKYLTRLCRFLETAFPRQLVLFRGHPLGTVDTFNHVIALRTDVDSIPWNEIRTWLEKAFSEDHYAFSWMARLGLAYAPEHGGSGSELISRAGFAALSTDVTINVYDPYTERKQNLQHFLILDLDRALRTGGIQLHYQPKVSLIDERVLAYEALIRWQHPEYGAISPGQWIPFAEQVGAIHSVTLWTIERAAQDLAALEQQSGAPVTVSVNISARDLARTDFHSEALAILARHRVSPQRLMLEITETAVMRDVDQARQMLEKLSHAGFRIALDDFGTGYSSLSALATFSLDELKIDRSFLTDIPTDSVRQRIFHAAVELGEALGLRIVVEGVESEAVAQWLKRYPGLCGQGYFWGRPAPLAATSVSGYDSVQSD